MKVIDMHCDTVSVLLEKRRKGENACLRHNEGHLDLERMRRGGYLLQNFALYVNKNNCTDPWEELCALYAVYQQELANNTDWLAPVLDYDDVVINEKNGKISAMLTVEEGAVCKGELVKLQKLYDMGVRMLTLTWNYPNELGHPNLDISKGLWVPELACGLTERGREFVTKMEQLGMIVDVSHLSDAGFYDVLECSQKPFVASHSNARSVCRCVRNLTDEMIGKLAERGGCMGLNYCADFLEEMPVGVHNPGNLEAVVRHVKHIVSVGGIEVLGLGSDFDGITTNEALPGAQSMELLWNTLHKAGFTQEQLDKIFYKNVLRVYYDCLS